MSTLHLRSCIGFTPGSRRMGFGLLVAGFFGAGPGCKVEVQDPPSIGESSESGPSTTESTTESTTTESSSEESACVGLCTDDDDCPPGNACIDCSCVPQNTDECESYGPGTYGNCARDGNAVCGNPTATCAVDDPGNASLGVCVVVGCEEACDCPTPPLTGTAEVTCGEILQDAPPACFLDCGGGRTCPDAMVCWNDICVHLASDPYSDCVNGQPCSGICLQATDDPLTGACAPTCSGLGAACPAPVGGTAAPVCFGFQGGDFACALDCTLGECPDGMICVSPVDNINVCVWEEEQGESSSGSSTSGETTGEDGSSSTTGGEEESSTTTG